MSADSKTDSKSKPSPSAVINMVPTHDSTGAMYSKREIRAMRKRARRGESRIELTSEEKKRLMDLKGKVDLDDRDLMGLVYKKNEVGEKRKLLGVEEESEGEGEEEEVDVEEKDDDEEDENDDEENDNDSASSNSSSNVVSEEPPSCPPVVGPKRSHKPVPPGYVCSACSGSHGVHWIFDCPIYLAKKGKQLPSAKVDKTEEERTKKKGKGITEPNKDKIFVSGLPFDTKKNDVMEFFSTYGTIKSLQLFCFDDTKRCQGNGIIQFETEKEAKKAIEVGNGKEMGGRWLKVVETRKAGGKKGGGRPQGQGPRKGDFKGKGKEDFKGKGKERPAKRVKK
ncbi:hypothetical protein TL16_g05222 [Triparma laevis f. inornata]|uniref:RRM domain-containing protein n=1 Tax=Triparma laevis f. inornata TaxID=1714386 RepID=A0A9W7E977_9STRA|nr:hypothetical protein TL16_g05222 [Triparma laevis f. inornata]